MRDPELVARAGYAAARLEQAWERWRALHGLGGSSDPLASYVGYSLKEPMGQPRVVIGVDAAEAEYFADFLESHECPGGVTGPERTAMNGPEPLPVAATQVFHQAPVVPGHPHDPSDPLAAELAGWASGELPGQASEQLATWGAAEPATSRAIDRPRSVR